MNPADQLARIAKASPRPAVRIYLLDRGFPVWSWLCAAHLRRRTVEGWSVSAEKDPPHPVLCDMCPKHDQTEVR